MLPLEEKLPKVKKENLQKAEVDVEARIHPPLHPPEKVAEKVEWI
jgi:hypothetical protein